MASPPSLLFQSHPRCRRQALAPFAFAYALRHLSGKAPPPPPKAKRVGRPRSSPATISATPPSVELPPFKQWQSMFPSIGRDFAPRISLANPETADKLANAILPEGSVGKVVIEAYPGPGQLTRSLLKLPRERLQRLIVMEPLPDYFDWLKPLEAIDDRIKIFPFDSFQWHSFKEIEEMGYLDGVAIQPWDGPVHPTLQFLSHIPLTVPGEQFVAQLCRAVPDRQWLFKFGRIPFDLITTLRMWQRLSASPEEYRTRCKVSVMREAVADLSEIFTEGLQPYSDHFHPKPKNSESKALGDRRPGTPHRCVRMVPLVDQIIKPGQLEIWDHVTRKLFMSKATPIAKGIHIFGPGAGSMLKQLTDPTRPLDMQLDPKNCPRSFTLHDWSLVVEAFREWPFRPEHLSIDVGFIEDRNR